MLCVGDLKHPLSLQENRASTKDAHGQPVDAWVEVSRVWCSVRPITGNEWISAGGQFRDDVTHIVRFRWRAGVVPQMRLVMDDGRVLNVIYAIDLREEKRFVECQCREVVNGA